jgi:phage terminase large subunit-like protein
MKEGASRGFKWDKAAAEKSISFFSDVLRLTGGRFEGKPFHLLDWQCFIVGSIYGWKNADGLRRFRKAYIETGKGSGKSPLAAGIGIKGLTADNEARAEIYSAATKKDQAEIVFRDAVAMVRYSPELSSRCHISGALGRETNIAFNKTMSFFRPISSDEKKSGPRPHVGLVDELHEHKDASAIEMLIAGFKGRLQALLAAITNAGSGKTSVCWNYHEYACQVCSGMLADDEFFGYVCALDENDDPFADEKCWFKTNPSLPALPGLNYLRAQVKSARGMPAKESLVKRLNFCIWTEADSPAISSHVWMSARRDLAIKDFIGRRCRAGLDLSSTTDLTAAVLAFEPRDEIEPWAVFPYFWLPGDGLADKAEKDRVPYLAWRDAGYLETHPGRAINKLAVIRRLAEICASFEVISIAYDRWRIEDLKMLMTEEGIELPLVPFGQGYKDMGPAWDEFERLLLNNRLVHPGNPVFTWNAANAIVVEDPAGNKKPAKDRVTGRMDGIVAAVMAIGPGSNVPSERSFWETQHAPNPDQAAA